MARPIDIVFYLPVRWEVTHRRPLIEALAKYGAGTVRILVVERPIDPIMTFVRHPYKLKLWREHGSRLISVNSNLYRYLPLVGLHDRVSQHIPGWNALNCKVLALQLRRQMERIGFTSPRRAAWLYNPMQRDYLGLVGETMRVYECYDEYASLPGRSERYLATLRRKEDQLLRRVDLVLATSKNLARTKGMKHPDVQFHPAGVDYELFAQAQDADTSVPDDLAAIPSPRLGYTGGMALINDFNLLARIAREKPEWSIVLIGSYSKELTKSEDFKYLRRNPNVYCFGWKSYETLPSYLKGLDVCLLPYLNTEWTRNMYPNKLIQYLAAGKPVVASRLPELEPFKDVVLLASYADEFISNAQYALENDSPALATRRMERAKEFSWERRAEEVMGYVDRLF
jgi:glycosyltransferase involved in cell wall biosynthesis